MENNEQSLVIRQQDIDLIGQSLPEAYRQSAASHGKCLEVGNSLLAYIQQHGMNDEMDQKAAKYIGASKATVKKINDLRSPATKLFDQFKKVFTTMEADIDPSKSGSIPYLIQQERNKYAAKKLEEENRRREEEARRQQAERDRLQYRTDCEEEFRRAFSRYVDNSVNYLADLFSKLTLDNYMETESLIKDFPAYLPSEWDAALTSLVRLPATVSREELAQIRTDVRNSLSNVFITSFAKTLEETKDGYLLRLPSKRNELSAIAAAAAADAERMKAELAAKEAAEAAARERERQEKEEKERKAAEAQQAMAEMDGLFGSAKNTVAAYVPKASVKKKISLLDVEGLLPILGMWLTEVGPTLTTAELEKEFKKQITYAEKKANAASPVFIESEFIQYVDDVKAK